MAAPRRIPAAAATTATDVPPADAAASDPVRGRVLERAWSGRRISVEVVESLDSRGGRASLDVVRHPGGVVILPLLDAADVPDPHLVLVRNRRVAVGRTLLELPAGGLEPGEAPDAAAPRELAEETGYRARRVEPFGGLWTAPGFCDERILCYVATGLEAVGQDLEAGEELEPVVMPASAVLAMIDDGRIEDAKTVALVQRWDRRRVVGGAPAERRTDADA